MQLSILPRFVTRRALLVKNMSKKYRLPPFRALFVTNNVRTKNKYTNHKPVTHVPALPAGRPIICFELQ